MPGLGRRRPPDLEHTEKYPLSAAKLAEVTQVEKTLHLPYWHWRWDQGEEGACVGFGTSMMLSILNEQQARATESFPIRRYDPWWLWDRAKEIDPWSETNPGDDNGTAVSAACEVLRTLGHIRYIKRKEQPVSPAEGISTYRWAHSVDDMRQGIANGIPISFGVDWYSNFDSPILKGKSHWIGDGPLGKIRGGHCVCIYGASDKKQAFKLKNSWGRSYPLTWIPYIVVERLLQDWGEGALVTDR